MFFLNKGADKTVKVICYKILVTVATIKDTWTISRGRVEVGEGGGFGWAGVEGWGEKAYNCN